MNKLMVVVFSTLVLSFSVSAKEKTDKRTPASGGCMWQQEKASFEQRVKGFQSAYVNGELSLARCQAHMNTQAYFLGTISTGCQGADLTEIQEAGGTLFCNK